MLRQDDGFLNPVPAPERVPARGGRRGPGAHVGEENARQLFDPIGGVVDLFPEAPALRLQRLLQTFSPGVELPAVIGAADAVRLDRAVVERGGAVRAVLADEAVLSASVAEQDQLLA